VFAAARQRGARAIGVDSDQFEAAPCCIVTSMVKRVDIAVIDVVKSIIAHDFHGGLHELGLKEDGVAFVSDERNRVLLPIDIVQRVHAIGDEIIRGAIVVPSE
jgi:basic membrane protein A